MKEVVLALVSLYTIENNGIRSLAAFLRQHHITVYEIYFKDYLNHAFIPPTEAEYANLIKLLREKAVNLIGLSVRASAYAPIAKDLTQRLKAELNVPIIWGGMHPTFIPEECAASADFLCLGESEHALLDFLRAWEQDGDLAVPNIWVNGPEGIRRTPIRPLISDLDALPFRDFHSHAYKFYLEGGHIVPGDPYIQERVYSTMASRGCPFACTFCDASILKEIYRDKGVFYRVRQASKVIEELQYAKQHFPRLRVIRFDDELFPPKRQWVEEFCAGYRANIGLPFEIHLDPRNVHEANLVKLKAAGLKSVFVGIQNTERINAELYDRHISNAKVLEAAGIIHKLKLKVCYQLILDDPVSTSQDKAELFNLLLQLPRPYELFLFSLTYWPRSPLARKLLEQGKITAEHIEDRAFKVFKQWRVDLNYPRSPADRFWISLIVLLSKNYLPKAWLRRLSRNSRLQSHPEALVYCAQVLNFLKMGWMAAIMLLKGELSWRTIKMWLNFKSVVTS